MPQKITIPMKIGTKVKMWGKSPQLMMVTSFAGKPCMLKCHIYHRPGLPGENGSFKCCRKAITMEGRQMDPVGQPSGQINDSPRQNPAYGFVAFKNAMFLSVAFLFKCISNMSS